MITDEQFTRYIEKYADYDLLEIKKQVRTLPITDPDREPFYEIFINDYIDNLTRGLIRYPKKLLNKAEVISTIEEYVDNYKDDFVSAYLCFLKGQHKQCVNYISKFIENPPIIEGDTNIDEQSFAYYIIEPFKNAFSGFYPAVRKALDNALTNECVKLLCDSMDVFYESEDTEKMSEALLPILQQYPNSIVGNLLMGYTQFQAKQWGSAIACFERVEMQKEFILFWEDDVWFYKGFSYTKLREHLEAIRCYKKALELNPNSQYALNNMGYEYYLTKQYSHALKIFKKCLDEDQDVGFAANNYVRTLLALGQNKKAKEFVDKKEYRIAASIIRRVDHAENSNKTISSMVIDKDEDADTIVDLIEETNNGQFSSEKLLEDELQMRIDAGIPVFGKHLKIYRRHGEYGRQYIIPIGRLDLLTEDDNGDLYIIELKKDSGYDDPYDQTVSYVEWFHKNHRKRGQKVYGIICLNNPSEKLIAKVRKDDRIQLFNYSISYDEVL